MPHRRSKPALALAGVLAAATLVPRPAAGQQDFHVRPTTPYACEGLIAARGPDAVWVGRFWGQKETNWDFKPYETLHVVRCFTDERNCRNWLYNMMSEYQFMVWTNECRLAAS